MHRVLDAPETNVAIFAFLLNVVWEFAQVSLFAGMRSAGHLTGILLCFRAALGDAVIVLVALWVDGRRTARVCSGRFRGCADLDAQVLAALGSWPRK